MDGNALFPKGFAWHHTDPELPERPLLPACATGPTSSATRRLGARFWLLYGHSLGLSDETHLVGLDPQGLLRGLMGLARRALDRGFAVGTVPLVLIGLFRRGPEDRLPEAWLASVLVFDVMAMRTTGDASAFQRLAARGARWHVVPRRLLVRHPRIAGELAARWADGSPCAEPALYELSPATGPPRTTTRLR